ncbi:hypothetical protein ACOMHN_035581 [Nucella lapillus]
MDLNQNAGEKKPPLPSAPVAMEKGNNSAAIKGALGETRCRLIIGIVIAVIVVTATTVGIVIAVIVVTATTVGIVMATCYNQRRHHDDDDGVLFLVQRETTPDESNQNETGRGEDCGNDIVILSG